jgi:hypothetical protein
MVGHWYTVLFVREPVVKDGGGAATKNTSQKARSNRDDESQARRNLEIALITAIAVAEEFCT